jgi:hypothetical protein
MKILGPFIVFALAVLAFWSRSRSTREPYEGLKVGLNELGRGVYTKKAQKKGSVVEVCPLILRDVGGDTSFADYVFGYDEEHESIPLGYCALYNHNQDPNVEADTDANSNTVVMKALRDIAPGEQLFMKYENGYFDERGKTMM